MKSPVELHRNGSGRAVITVGDIIKIALIIISGLVFYFKGVVELQTLAATQSILIDQNKTQIELNRIANERQDLDIRYLERTKADRNENKNGG